MEHIILRHLSSALGRLLQTLNSAVDLFPSTHYYLEAAYTGIERPPVVRPSEAPVIPPANEDSENDYKLKNDQHLPPSAFKILFFFSQFCI